MLRSLRSVAQFRPLEFNRDQRRLNRSANIDDLRRHAKRRLPGGVFDYIDGGAEDERSLHSNSEAFHDIAFRPRVLRGIDGIDTSSSLLGRSTPLPLVLAPTGFTRMADPEGELAVARATARRGIPYSLSTMSTRSIEEVAAASDSVKWGGEGERRLWFQVYAWKDRGLVNEMIDRAAHEHYEALVLTVDTAVLGRRERDVRRGMSMPPKLGLGTIFDGIRHPGWTMRFLTNPPIVFANVVGNQQVGDGSTAINLAAYAANQFDSSLSWAEIDWLRSVWDGKVIVKGIQTPADAAIAAEVGVDAIILSNHGGRQLDDAPAPIEITAACRAAAGDGLEIIVDGGVRRGADIVKARALGADAAMVGRAYLYALGAAGERGVEWMLDFMAEGVARTMALCGLSTIDEITEEAVRTPSRFSRDAEL